MSQAGIRRRAAPSVLVTEVTLSRWRPTRVTSIRATALPSLVSTAPRRSALHRAPERGDAGGRAGSVVRDARARRRTSPARRPARTPANHGAAWPARSEHHSESGAPDRAWKGATAPASAPARYRRRSPRRPPPSRCASLASCPSRAGSSTLRPRMHRRAKPAGSFPSQTAPRRRRSERVARSPLARAVRWHPTPPRHPSRSDVEPPGLTRRSAAVQPSPIPIRRRQHGDVGSYDPVETPMRYLVILAATAPSSRVTCRRRAPARVGTASRPSAPSTSPPRSRTARRSSRSSSSPFPSPSASPSAAPRRRSTSSTPKTR